MISTMGDGPAGNARGQFLMLDGKDNFKVKGQSYSFSDSSHFSKFFTPRLFQLLLLSASTSRQFPLLEMFLSELIFSLHYYLLLGTWSNVSTKYGYDFWYQPLFDVMVSTEWGAPKSFKTGLNLTQLNDYYGHSLNVWSWTKKKLIQTIDLGTTNGWLPLEVRFLHNPKEPHGYVACALSSTIFHITKTSTKWTATQVIAVPTKTVKNWWVGLNEMPGVITDILISMDDKYLYLSNWVHGDIRQYDISKRDKPKLVGKVFVGGSIVRGGPVTVLKDSELPYQPEPLCVKGKRIEGGPQMLQLSLDGKRLYVTTSLFTNWDKQFYPELVKKGACLLQIDVNTEKGGLTINRNFLVDYGAEPKGPVLAHEIHYPGGDCSSDIFLPQS